MQIVVDGLLTNYQRLGGGKVVIILHGWGDDSRSWLVLGKSLAKRYTVIIPDLPGFGGSQAPELAWGIDNYASFVAAFLKKLEIKDLYTVVGHSNGGAIAIRGLASGKLTSEKLVLLASAGIRGEYKGRNKALRLVTKTGKALTAPLPQSTKRKLRQKVYRTVGSDMLVAEHLQETFKKVVTDDVRADAKGLAVPSLLMYGQRDEQTPVRYGQIFHGLIEDSTLEILSDAGHFLQLDQSTKVEHAIEEFLR